MKTPATTFGLLALLGLSIYSCSVPSPSVVDNCEERPLTAKEKAFAQKFDPKLDYTTIRRPDYNMDVIGKSKCKMSESKEYSYWFDNEPDTSFMDLSILRKKTVDCIVELYTNVLSNEVIYETETFNFWFDNNRAVTFSDNREGSYEVDIAKETVAAYVGFEVVKEGKNFVRKTIEKHEGMPVIDEDFEPFEEK